MSEDTGQSGSRIPPRLAERHAVLRRLTAELAAAADTGEICQVTVDRLRDGQLGITAASVWLVDPVDGRLRIRAGDAEIAGPGEVVVTPVFAGEFVIGELRVARGEHGEPIGHDDQQLLDAVARLVDMALSRNRLAAKAAAGAPAAWMESVTGSPGARRVQVGTIPADRLSEVYFGEDRGHRPLRWAAVVAIAAHFIAFMLVLPDLSRDLPDLSRDLTVIKRYKPPPPEQVERKQVKRTATRVPIPDPTPNDPEPIVPDEPEELPQIPVDTIYIADLPISSPLPRDFLDALDMETADLIPPTLVRRVQPRYDRDRARRGIQGSVDLQILIDDAGRVTFAQVVNSTGDEELDRLALDAVQQWEFTAAILDGVAVAVRAVVTINFRIY